MHINRRLPRALLIAVVLFSGCAQQPHRAVTESPSAAATELAVVWLPDCPYNNADTATIETCATAMTTCAEGVRMRRWTAPAGAELGTPNWTSAESRCRTAADLDAEATASPAVAPEIPPN